MKNVPKEVCADAIDRLSALLDGELPASDRIELQCHLDGCTSCEQQRVQLVELRSAYQEAAGLGPTAGFAGRVASLARALPPPRPSLLATLWQEISRARRNWVPRTAFACLSFGGLAVVAGSSSLGLLKQSSESVNPMIFEEWCNILTGDHTASAAMALAVLILGLILLRFPAWLMDVVKAQSIGRGENWRMGAGLLTLGTLVALTLWVSESAPPTIHNRYVHLNSWTCQGGRTWIGPGLDVWTFCTLVLLGLALYRCSLQSLTAAITHCAGLGAAAIGFERAADWISTTTFGFYLPSHYSSGSLKPTSLPRALSVYGGVDPLKLDLAVLGTGALLGIGVGLFISGPLAYRGAHSPLNRILVGLSALVSICTCAWAWAWSSTIIGPDIPHVEGLALARRVVVLHETTTFSDYTVVPGWIPATAASPQVAAALSGPYSLAADRAYRLKLFTAACLWDDQSLMQLKAEQYRAMAPDASQRSRVYRSMMVMTRQKLSNNPIDQIFEPYQAIAKGLAIGPADWMVSELSSTFGSLSGSARSTQRAEVKGRLLVDGRPAAHLALRLVFPPNLNQGSSLHSFSDDPWGWIESMAYSTQNADSIDPYARESNSPEFDNGICMYVAHTDSEGRFVFKQVGNEGPCALAVLFTGTRAVCWVKKSHSPTTRKTTTPDPSSVYPRIECQNGPGLIHPGTRDLDLGDIRLEFK